jgi:hypothetical protein
MPGCERADFDSFCAKYGENPDDPLHEEAWNGLRAYEEALRLKWGRVVHANYTWRSLRKQGLILTMEDHILNRKKPTQGFLELVSAGKPDLTDEYQLLKFSAEVLEFRNGDLRTKQAMQVAEMRLCEVGCAMPQ